MKINPFNVYNNIQTSPVSDKTARTDMDKTKGAKNDYLTLSKDAVGFTEALNQAKKSDDIRAQKVERIKEQLSKGTYNVKAEDIARKMIEASRMNHLFRR